MRYHRAVFVFATAVLGSLPGCNTASRGTTQAVKITSVPDGASCSVQQSGKVVGTVAPTPGSLVVPRSLDNLTVTCSKPGYATASVTKFSMRTDTQGLGIFAVGALVDQSSGANNSYPPVIRVPLSAVDGPDS